MTRIVKKFGERKADILRTARKLFKTKEYEKTTMQDVMEALNIAKGTIYHYFKSKEELLEAVIEDIIEENFDKMQNLIKAAAEENALEKMKLLVKAGRIAADNNDILDHLHQPGNYAMHTRLLAAILIKHAPLYAELIRQGCEEGIFKTETPLECAEFLLSGVQFLTDVGIYPWTQQDLTRRMQAFPKLIEQLLLATPGSFQFLID
jgi:AcrR family transcriptional regulator